MSEIQDYTEEEWKLEEACYLAYFKEDKDIIGIRCVDLEPNNKLNNIKDLLIETIFLPIIKNEEQNIKEYPNVKVIELKTSTDNFDLSKLDENNKKSSNCFWQTTS